MDVRGFFGRRSHTQDSVCRVALSIDEIAVVASKMTPESMLVSLHISREWATAVLNQVGQDFVSRLVSKALSGDDDRDSLHHINDIAARGRQLGFGNLEAMFDQSAVMFCFRPFSTEKEIREKWEVAKRVLVACPVARAAVARRASCSLEFRDTINVLLLGVVVRHGAGSDTDRLAWNVMDTLVERKGWSLARAFLTGLPELTDSDAWKRALFGVMKNRGLEEKQAVAFCEAFCGRNCFITGAGGCGKSHVVDLLKEAIAAIDTVAILAPTRVGAARIGGETYHSWGCFRPTRITMDDIKKPCIHPRPLSKDEGSSSSSKTNEENQEKYDATMVLEKDEVFVPVESDYTRRRVARVKTIILDEVSMMSPFHFDCLDFIVRQYSECYERVQWILVGDFCQLPSILIKDTIEYKAHENKLTKRFLFEMKAWESKNMFSIQLDVNRRSATNVEFCKILANARLGLLKRSNPRALNTVVEKLKLITATSLPSPQFGIFPTTGPVRWAPMQPNCNKYNDLHRESLTTPMIKLDAVDSKTPLGAVCFSIPSQIIVKIGESLRVMRGDDKGTIGTLVEVQADKLVLETETGGKATVGRFAATRTITEDKKTATAVRHQFMVKTSFGLTVHGVQGKSMRRFVVGCAGFWEHGQAYVALSRATDPAIMQLLDIEKLEFICDHRVVRFYKALDAQELPAYTL